MNVNYLKRYILSSYILVWALIIFVAAPASLLFKVPPVVMWIVRNIVAWSPSYLLLFGWKYFRTDEEITTFLKRCFSAKVSLLPLLSSFGITFGLSILSLFIYSLMTQKTMFSYINLGTVSLPLSIFLSFTSGPTGEEFNKKYHFLKSSIYQGLVWCFWHTLLWVVDSKFTDWRAIPYIIANIVVITSITILMNIILEKYNNLIYTIFMHFGFNIVYVFLDADIGFFIILTLLYLLITPIAMHIRNRSNFKYYH